MCLILDDGICTVARKVNQAGAGEKPRWGYSIIYRSWYAVTSFSTASRPQDSRENSRVSARIRVLQNRQITNHDIVVLASVDAITDDLVRYEVLDAWHGPDDDNGTLITNMNLELIV